MSTLSFLFSAVKESLSGKAHAHHVQCPVCKASTSFLDAVDFNKSCEEARGLTLDKSGEFVRYYLCDVCGFCFAPELYGWTKEKFERKIYNEQYGMVDPDYRSVRPTNNAEFIDQTFGAAKPSHIDYGGGSGLLSKMLQAKFWHSQTYDPFVDKDLKVENLGRFDLVTAFEVFEHVPDLDALFADLNALVKPDGMILFSTLFSDGAIKRGQPLTWWYAAPRNGHISLFSAESMRRCMEQHGYHSSSASANLHTAYREIPRWAAHMWK